MRKIYCILLLFILIGNTAMGQAFLKQNEHQQRLTNGLNLFYTEQPGVKAYEMMLSFRFGASAEDTTTDGLGYVCHTVFLNGLQQHLKAVNSTIQVDARYGFELSTYKFTVPVAQYKQVLDAVAKHYAQKPDSIAIANAINQNTALFSILQNTLLYPAEQGLIERQWNLRAPSMSLYGPIPNADSATIAKVSKLYADGYCIEFALLAFNGPEPFRTVWSATQDGLSYISSCPGELFNTKMANLYPAPNLSSQLVFGVGNTTPTRYQKSYHGPYVSFDADGAVAAVVLKQLLTQSPSLDSICDSLYLNKVLMAYAPMYSASSLTWHIFPNPDSMHLAYHNFDTLINSITNNNVFTQAEIEGAKGEIVKQFESVINDPSQKLYLVSQYWVNNTLHWLSQFKEMVKGIDKTHISQMVKQYIVGQKYSTLLLLNDADSSAYDINQFATTYSNIKGVQLNFQRNTAQLATGKDDTTYNALEQTILINKDLLVSVNAQAYKSELVNVKDDSLAYKLGLYKGYYIYPNSLLKSNNAYRLDIYRTATLINKLLEAGVRPYQLVGTGKLLKGKEEGEEYKIIIDPVFDKKKP